MVATGCGVKSGVLFRDVAAARERGLALETPGQFDSGSGIGVRSTLGGRSLALGNTTLITQLSVDLTPLAADARSQGASVMHLAVDARLACLLAVSDPVKATPPDALASLRAAGLRVVMATGDGLTTARAVGGRIGIDEVHREVKPADKLELVAELQAEGRRVAMAGDGITTTLRRWHVPTCASRWARYRRGHEQRAAHAREGRTAPDRRRTRAVSGHGRKHEAEPRLCLRLQRAGHSAGRRGTVPIHRLSSPMIAVLAMSLSSASVITNALRLCGAELQQD